MSVQFENNSGMIPVRFPKDYPVSVFDMNHPNYNDVHQNTSSGTLPTPVATESPIGILPTPIAPESTENLENVSENSDEDCVCEVLGDENESDDEIVERSDPIITRSRRSNNEGITY